MSPSAVIAFGPFALNTSTRQLLHGDREIRLSPKAFELLWFLTQERPRAVAKAEIHARLWGNTHVTDMSVAAVISEIRRALQDTSQVPLYIRTIHGFGYAFCGE